MDLNDLKIRPTVKAPSDVVVKFGRKKVVEKDHPMFAEEKDAVASKPNETFVLDMRETSRINRELILEKLRKYISNPAPGDLEKVSLKNVEKESSEEKKEEKDNEVVKKAKEPVNEKEPEIKKAKPKVVLEEAKDAKEDKEVAQKKPIAKSIGKIAKYEGDLDSIVIGADTIETRLGPSQNKKILRAASYYMNNRRLFQQKLAELFKPHKSELMKPDDNVSCDFRKEGSKFELLTHQNIVRDYLNLYSPYRGLLIYHGLGSGKTCTSIAIAEGMKSDRPVYVLTPASLSMNYMSELKKCGDPLYKKNQFWEFIDTKKEPQHLAPLASVMALTEEFVRHQGGVWMVNVKNESNYESLSSDEKDQIEKQIDAMIQAKYRNVNYNANNFMSKLTHYAGGEGINPFNNSVVIVDEAHNLVSRIVNKLNKPESTSYKIYQYLMSATNVKVIFLSGTPIINYPNEIAIMFNMLRGFIKTWTFNVRVTTANKTNKEEILKWFDKEKFRLFDYLDYSGDRLTITRNPFGFVSMKKRANAKGLDEGADEFDKYDGIALGEEGNMTDEAFEANVKRILKKHNVEVAETGVTIENHTALPDEKDAFINMFIDIDTGIIKNVDLLQRRILGLTSYFKSAQEKLLPRYKKDTDFSIVAAEMSDYQFDIYALARKDERDRDKKNNQKKHMGKEMFSEMSSTYRVFSRAFCNFAFPDPPGRPMAKNMKSDLGEGKGAGIDKGNADSLSEDEIDAVHVDEETQEESKATFPDAETYENKLKSALKYLKDHSADILHKDHLQQYSHKLLKLLENITTPDHAGLHLVYSQFRTIEGIGIIKLILEANGFAEFKLVKNAGSWDIKETEGDEGLPRFVLYTGTESKEEKEIVRNIYNSNWSSVPETVKVKLNAIAGNNYMGEIIKIFMITASGAEGINLENTRYVHIVEPYWHPVRTEQVVGRARRICSHSNLPEELRDVHVFLYLSVLSKEQKTSKKNIELRTNDVSRTNKSRPVTTDEYLYELSNTKDEISRQILKAVKETAMDCSLHKSKEEKLVCYTFGKVSSNEFSSVPNLEMDATQKTDLNVNTAKITGRTVEIYGVKYIQRKEKNGKYTDELYNSETQELAGRLVIEGDKVRIEV
jgi:hypothetical protein